MGLWVWIVGFVGLVPATPASTQYVYGQRQLLIRWSLNILGFGFEFGVLSLGFCVWGLGIGEWGLGFWVLGLEFWVLGLRFGVRVGVRARLVRTHELCRARAPPVDHIYPSRQFSLEVNYS